MVTKVGSVGHVVDSVIQYPQNGGRQEAEKREVRQPKQQTEHRRPVGERVVPASEKVHEQNTRTTEMGTNQLPLMDGRAAPVVPNDMVVLETVDGEIIENRAGIELSEEAVKITVDDVNKRISPSGASIEFSYHEKTGRYSFKVLEVETGKILREVPPQKSLDMVAKMFEMAGLIVDEKL